jgi:hypothetical protein
VIAPDVSWDCFIAWRAPAPPLPAGLAPVCSGGGPWRLLAVAELRRVRVAGWRLPFTCRVAAWLVPCVLPDGCIGNLFRAAWSDDPATALAMRAIGLPARWARLRIDGTVVAVPGCTVRVGAAQDAPDLAWFAADRCGIVARRHGWRRLPLAKRHWRMQLRHAPGAVAGIEVGDDRACWGRPR